MHVTLVGITLLAGIIMAMPAAAQNTFYVATDGSDNSNGSATQEWKTITHALKSVPDSSLILVREGVYDSGEIDIHGQFDSVTVKSEVPYRARLRSRGKVLKIFNVNADVHGITIEGFDIAHLEPASASDTIRGPLVVQIKDGRAPDNSSSTPEYETRDITLHNNILHDSRNNDILKVNEGASDIKIIGNMFYNQGQRDEEGTLMTDEHLDINSVRDVVVTDNIFFNNFAASRRTHTNTTGSFIIVKDSDAEAGQYIGSSNVYIGRNVLLNWQGTKGSYFMLFGEDKVKYSACDDILVENNLILGNSADSIRAAFGVKGCGGISFRHNTIQGDLPGEAFAMRLNREPEQPPNPGDPDQVVTPPVGRITIVHNVFSDNSGTMNRFAESKPGTLEYPTFSEIPTLRRNGYWNGARRVPLGLPPSTKTTWLKKELPENDDDVLNPVDDQQKVWGDPLLSDLGDIKTPHWIPSDGEFYGGYQTIREAFRDLVMRYGKPAGGSALLGRASGAEVPRIDILKLWRRRGAADLGCFEVAPIQPPSLGTS